MTVYLETFTLLIFSHFICDYVFQTDAIANGKNRMLDPAKFGVNWQYWMTSHAATHAVGVYIITHNIWLCLFEFTSHWLIDWAKCEGKINLNQDQALHIVCKVIILIGAFING